ncbi:MAG: hypothetical protein M1825_000764 [Sarcosagium campestre]|nr:MAG: hypothetical protein M1825_000764 [Sarcosagium campestre]
MSAEKDSKHPLRALQLRLPELIKEASYSEVFHVDLSTVDPPPASTTLILQKFLRANENDVERAAAQLLGVLKWRKEYNPRAAADEEFDIDKFGGLGYITVIKGTKSVEGDKSDDFKGKDEVIVSWNIYGAAKDTAKVFGDVDAFIRWRVALMERSLARLSLSTATLPIPDYGQGADPYQMVQVHDYLSVRFLRMDPTIRAASSRIIALFQAQYPELLSRKFFVNVPVVMGWVYAGMKVFMAKDTARKLSMLSYGEQLVRELGPGVPVEYGGKGPSLVDGGETVRFKTGDPAVSVIDPDSTAASTPLPPATSTPTAAATPLPAAASSSATPATTAPLMTQSKSNATPQTAQSKSNATGPDDTVD